jgi:hypothetical protein
VRREVHHDEAHVVAGISKPLDGIVERCLGFATRRIPTKGGDGTCAARRIESDAKRAID